MNLRSMLLRGFISWKDETRIDFKEGLTLITAQNLDDPDHSASMGGGKSSLLYAICWALWGKVPPGGGVTDVINHQSEGAYVELVLQGEHALMRIERYKPVRGKSLLKYTYGVVACSGDIDYVQGELNKIHGISWEVFCNTIFTSPLSEVQQFVSATPGKRAQLLGELVNDHVFQEAAKKLSGQISELAKELAKIEASKMESQKQEAFMRSTIERLSQQIADQHIIQQRAEQQVKEKTLVLQEEILKLQDIVRAPIADETQIIAQQNATQRRIDDLEREMLQHRYVMGRQLPNAGATCPTCEQPISTQMVRDLDLEKKLAQEQIAKITRDLHTYREALRVFAEERGNLLMRQQQKTSAAQRIDDLKMQALQLRDTLENRTIVVLHEELQHSRQRLQEIMNLLAERDQQIADITLRVPVLKTLRNGFANEIRNMLFDELRQVLGHYTNVYTQHLAGNEFQIEFPPTTETGKEKFEIVIRSAGKANPLTSGGETYRAQFAVLLALRRALTFGQSCPYRFMLVDDPLSQLDDTGIQAFFRLLRMVLPDFPTILVTVPRDITGIEADHLIRVERRNRVSTIKDHI